MSETIQIPIEIKSRNVTNKQHWAAKSRIKKEYQVLIRNKMRIRKIKKAEKETKYIVAIVSHRKRLIDYDNLDVKILLDSLTAEGFIFDDAPKYIGKPIIEQEKSSKEYTEIVRHKIS